MINGMSATARLNLPDGIHPNARGHEIVAELVYRHLKALL